MMYPTLGDWLMLLLCALLALPWLLGGLLVIQDIKRKAKRSKKHDPRRHHQTGASGGIR